MRSNRAQDGQIYIEKINGPFLFELRGTPAEFDRAIANGWLVLHERDTYVRFTEAGARGLRAPGTIDE